MSSITHWKWAGALVNPNGILSHLNFPLWHTKVAYLDDTGSKGIYILWYPAFKSMRLAYLRLPILWRTLLTSP
jgi:hypothetical protein